MKNTDMSISHKAIYGLPQAGILANKLLEQLLAPGGYYKVAHMPDLWCHISCPTAFTLAVDDFGIKLINKANADHSSTCLQQHYTLLIYWEGSKFCGIQLKWN